MSREHNLISRIRRRRCLHLGHQFVCDGFPGPPESHVCLAPAAHRVNVLVEEIEVRNPVTGRPTTTERHDEQSASEINSEVARRIAELGFPTSSVSVKLTVSGDLRVELVECLRVGGLHFWAVPRRARQLRARRVDVRRAVGRCCVLRVQGHMLESPGRNICRVSGDYGLDECIPRATG